MVACTWAPREALGGGKGEWLGGGWQLGSGSWAVAASMEGMGGWRPQGSKPGRWEG